VALLGDIDFKKIGSRKRKSGDVGISTGFLYRRNITKLANGAKIDWNSGPVVKGIEKAVLLVNKRGARRVKRMAQGILRRQAYDNGDLYRSIEINRSRYQYGDWIISAGNEKVDYAMHIEAGWYHKRARKRVGAKPGKWVYAVPYMRTSAASTRKWMKPRMEAAIRRVLA